MSDYISATLQDGSEAVALAARPLGPQAIRARGDRRRRRNAAGLAVSAMAVAAVGAGAYPLAHDLGTVPASAAGQRYAVPRVAGDSLASAERAIRRAGLSVGSVRQQYSAAVSAGLVISTSPVPGTAESGGARVGIVVSAQGASITVPNVLGMTVGTAVSLVQQVGLQVEVRHASAAAVAAGSVYAMSPAAGSLVPRGVVVVLYVATAGNGS